MAAHKIVQEPPPPTPTINVRHHTIARARRGVRLRSVRRSTATPITGTERLASIFLSGDGHHGISDNSSSDGFDGYLPLTVSHIMMLIATWSRIRHLWMQHTARFTPQTQRVILYDDGGHFSTNNTHIYRRIYEHRRAWKPPTYHPNNSGQVHRQHSEKGAGIQQSTAVSLLSGQWKPKSGMYACDATIIQW